MCLAIPKPQASAVLQKNPELLEADTEEVELALPNSQKHSRRHSLLTFRSGFYRGTDRVTQEFRTGVLTSCGSLDSNPLDL